MTTSAVIPINKEIHNSENYAFLRKEGLSYVEQLSSDFWTDFNMHDPGITFLEALCYAITDLGYRTSLPMKDLLAKKGMDYSDSIPPLFTARNILTNNPLTITDYRKLLVDIEGIKNAWLEVADCQEVDFYADCKKSKLKYFATNYKIDLKKKRKELEQAFKTIKDDPDNRNLKTIFFPFTVKAEDGEVSITNSLEILLPGWDVIEENQTNYINFLNLDTIDEISFQQEKFDNSANTWSANFTMDYTIDGSPKKFILKGIKVLGVNNLEIRDALKDFITGNSSVNPIFLYHQQIKETLSRAIEHTIRLRGLWEVLLQYDVDDRYGDLNSNLMNYEMIIETGSGSEEVELEIVGPVWQTLFHDIKTYEPFILSNEITDFNFFNSFSGTRTNTFTTDIQIKYIHEGNAQVITFENIIFKGIHEEAKLVTDIFGILNFFQGKLYRTYEITREAECKLHKHRNLCEDFKKISSIRVNEIGICVDIDLENSASLIKTQADIIFQIQQYISPSINFYSLKEMVDKEIPSEEIFNGPKLEHGFIISEEIEKSQLSVKRFIYASDIINIIQDIPGVISVKNLLLTKYDKSGNPILPSEPWCLRIDPLHKAELSIKKSKMLFFKEDLPYVLSGDKYDKMLEEVDKLRTLHERFKLVKPNLDFPVPEGSPLNLEDYSPIRFSLPKTYGVGATGLPESVSEARKGKAKQLSAFLSFFDHLLANYLSQLSNLGNLFSVDPHDQKEAKKTYYNQLLTEENLAVSFTNPSILTNGDKVIDKDTLQRLTESGDDYLDRRNRFLDHLLGRFAEDFTEYALIVFSREDEETQQELIYDKAKFLGDYPAISFERGKAFAYKHCISDKKIAEVELWNTQNVVGLKKRASKLLGMPDYLRQDLHCPTIRDEFEIYKVAGNYTFRLMWGNLVTHTSPKRFGNDYEAAFFAKEEAIMFATNLENYLDGATGSQHYYQVIAPNSDPASPDIYLKSEPFSSELLRDQAKHEFYQRITSDFGNAPLYRFHIEKSGANYSFQMLHRNAVVLGSLLSFTDEAFALATKQYVTQLLVDEINYRVFPIGTKFILQVGYYDSNNHDDLLVVFCETTQQFDSEIEAKDEIENFVHLFKRSCLECQVFDVYIDNVAGGFKFRLKEGAETDLEGQNVFATKDEVLIAIERVIELSHDQMAYTIDPADENDSGPFKYQIGVVTRDEATEEVQSNDVLAINLKEYTTHGDALQDAAILQRKLNSDPHCQIEGMHIIEHLLLRPRHEFEDEFFDVCLDKDCFLCGQEDPYSFRVSAVFPYWTRKFSVSDPKLKIRKYVDKLLRQEAPAHVHLKVCWVNNFQMRLLDIHYKRWLNENAKLCPDAFVLSGRLNALLDILGKLRSRYPEAFLHDCDDSELENTVLLDKTFLGSYHSADEA